MGIVERIRKLERVISIKKTGLKIFYTCDNNSFYQDDMACIDASSGLNSSKEIYSKEDLRALEHLGWNVTIIEYTNAQRELIN